MHNAGTDLLRNGEFHDHDQKKARGQVVNFSISVAMCTYNGSRNLPEQLDSLLRQERPPDEVVVCDDGSTDDTHRLLAEFSRIAPFPVKTFWNPKNLGFSQNFAQAVNLCSGEIISLCDQDDLWYPQKLKRLEVLFYSDPKAGGIFSDGDLIDSDSRLLPGTLWGSFDFQQSDMFRMKSADAVRVLLRRNVVTGMALAFRREWRDCLRLMPEHWPHDFWLALMLAADGALRPCPERLVAYRVHTNQQIGVPITRAQKWEYLRSRGVGAYRALSRERNLREYSKDSAQFESLLRAADEGQAIASGEPSSLAQRWWMPLARNKALHMRRGMLQLQQRRFQRWASALYHWKSYRDYAPTGLAALARDLLL